MGVPGDYAPLAFHNEAGELRGYDVDMAKDLGQKLGLKVTFVLTSWPTLSSDLKADKFDIAMGGVTETRNGQRFRPQPSGGGQRQNRHGELYGGPGTR